MSRPQRVVLWLVAIAAALVGLMAFGEIQPGLMRSAVPELLLALVVAGGAAVLALRR